MKVIKRDGSEENVKFDKISARIKKQTYGLDVDYVDYLEVSKKVISGVYDGVTSKELDNLAAETAASMARLHPDYSILAARIALTSLKKETKKSFKETVEDLYSNINVKTGESAPLISDELYSLVQNHGKKIESMIVHDRDLSFEYFGFKTLEKSYLLKIDGKIVETPQHMYLRVALGIWGDNFDQVQKTYELLSTGEFTHATPTLFNSGTRTPQLSSCFLVANKSDDIDGLFETLQDVANISKWAGGVGLHVHNVRARGSYIKGTGGNSDGLLPMLKTYNEVARWINQCFAPETLIYTNDGVKRIEDLKEGELVLTRDGKYCEVGEVMSYSQVGCMLEIETKSTLKPLRLTDEHPLFAFKNTYNRIGRSNDEYINQLEKGIISPDWIDSCELKVGDFIGKAIPKEVVDVEMFSEEDAFIYGLLLGDGHISGYEVGISFNEITNSDSLFIVRNYLVDRDVKFWESRSESEFYLQIRFSLSNLPWLNENLLYDEQGDKRLHNSLSHLPLNKSLQIINGLIKSDGGVYRRNEIHFYNTSEVLIENLSYQILRFKVPTYGSWVERENNSKYILEHGCKKEFTLSCDLRIPAFKELSEILNIEQVERKNWIVWEGVLYTRITSVKMLDDYNGRVYDLKIKENSEDPSYTLSSALVHNGGKRKGSFAIYLEPWHSDVEEFIDLRKNHGKEELRARDLFLAIWTPDLFMRRILQDGDWTLMCPNECPGLSDVYDSAKYDAKTGEVLNPEEAVMAFTELYEMYESQGKGKKTVKARELWGKILEAEIETGTPYILYKDSANNKSNQKNLGTIKSSNLCTEIIEYSAPDEQAVCNLASIALPKMVIIPEGKVKSKDKSLRSYDFERLYDVTYQTTLNLNRVIDVNWYPTKETEKSNMRHRPIGIGVQGLADTFAMLNLPFESDEAKKLNRDIFETIYFASMTASNDMAKKLYKEEFSANSEAHFTAGAYSTFAGSPLSEGKFQFNLWDLNESELSGLWDWDKLRKQVVKYGVRNSLLLAPMPTASTAQILGNNECFEPYTSNIYKRNTLSGEFVVVNRHLVEDLISLGLWKEEMRIKMTQNQGSIQAITEIPEKIREVYKTVWEMKASNLIDMSADRGAFICQSQSMNLFIRDVNIAKLNKALFYGWTKGLKTGMYYLRSNAQAEAKKSLGEDMTNIEIAPELIEKNQFQENQLVIEMSQAEIDAIAGLGCSLDNPDCLSCGA